MSFGSDVFFNFNKDDEFYSINLPKNSVYIISGDARYLWKHGISFGDYNVDNKGNRTKRTKRISMTFRNISDEYLTNELRIEAGCVPID